MKVSLKYGRKIISVDIKDKNISQILLPDELPAVPDPGVEVEKSLSSPIGTLPLAELVRQKAPENVVIIVNDVTRPTPCKYMLPPILRILENEGVTRERITLLMATGLHEPNSHEQNVEVFGDEILQNYKLIPHMADKSELVDYGNLSSGIPLLVNKIAADADFIITLGAILHHYMAGFSGGRKSILPGVAGRETIQKNHSRQVDMIDNMPPLKDNPVSLEMIEAARKVGVDFIVNSVPNSKGEIVKIVAGDLEKAWYEGTRITAKVYEVPLEELADVTIVSACGYPRDINTYQAQKALDHADKATRIGGTIIFLAECIEGLGEPVFEEWMEKANSPEEIIEWIREEFVMGGHKAYLVAKVAKKKKIIMVSSLDEKTTKMLFAEKCASLNEALERVKSSYGPDFKCVIMPEGSVTVPVLNKS